MNKRQNLTAFFSFMFICMLLLSVSSLAVPEISDRITHETNYPSSSSTNDHEEVMNIEIEEERGCIKSCILENECNNEKNDFYVYHVCVDVCKKSCRGYGKALLRLPII